MEANYLDIYKQIKTSLTATNLLKKLNKNHNKDYDPLLRYEIRPVTYSYFCRRMPLSFKYVRISEKVYRNIMDKRYKEFSKELADEYNKILIKNRLIVKKKMANIIESKTSDIEIRHKLLRIINPNAIDDIIHYKNRLIYEPRYLLNNQEDNMKIYDKEINHDSFIDIYETHYMNNEFIQAFIKEYGIVRDDIYINKRHPYMSYNIGGFRERFPFLMHFRKFKHPSILVFLFNDLANKSSPFAHSITKDVVECYNFKLYLYKMIKEISVRDFYKSYDSFKNYTECSYYNELDDFYKSIISKYIPIIYQNKFIDKYRFMNSDLNLVENNNAVIGRLINKYDLPYFDLIIDKIKNIIKFNSIKTIYGKFDVDYEGKINEICKDINDYIKNTDIINFIRCQFLDKDFIYKYFNNLQSRDKYIYDYDQFNGKRFEELNEEYFINSDEIFKDNLVTY